MAGVISRTNADEWESYMQDSEKNRFAYNEQVEPLPGGLPEAPRLYPRRETVAKPLWLRCLLLHRRGFFVLMAPDGGRKLLFFSATVRGEACGIRLAPTAVMGSFTLDTGRLSREHFVPVLQLATFSCLKDDAVLYVTPLNFEGIRCSLHGIPNRSRGPTNSNQHNIHT